MEFPNIQEVGIFEKFIDDPEMDAQIVARILENGDEMNYTTNVKSDVTYICSPQKQFDRPYPEMNKLKKYVTDFCKESSREMNMAHEWHNKRFHTEEWNDEYVANQNVNGMWASRATTTEVTVPHNHWPNTWAFCYYIDPPEGCSDLIFPTVGKEVKVEHGKLVIFQGHLMHETVSKRFEGDRFVVAGTVVNNIHPNKLMN